MDANMWGAAGEHARMLPVLRNFVRVSIKVGHGDSPLCMEGTWKLLDLMIHLGLSVSLAPKRTDSFAPWGVRACGR